jgi:hypothetical protein
MTKLLAMSWVALLAAALSPAQESQTAASPAAAQSASPATSSKSTSTSTAHSTTGKSKKTRKSTSKRRVRGQQKIDPKRTLEIQEALIREHYLTGKPTGIWNDTTQQAMQRYQADNNWQSKTTPDARALIKLGLGPDHDHLLNPESAMTSQPASTPASAPAPGKQ